MFIAAEPTIAAAPDLYLPDVASTGSKAHHVRFSLDFGASD
jgi:hypothetical protein